MSQIPPEQRPFRFGLLADTRNATRASLIEMAKRAEARGVSVLLGSDHLGRWSPLPLLQAAAEATSLRVGTLVLNNDFRHPALLAQDIATIDLLTDGRAELGIGAGWDRSEYERAGLTFDPPPKRVARMQTSVRLLKQAFREGKMDHIGDESYPPIHLEDLRLSTQRPHPPILVGGGRRKILSFAAREADIVGLDPRSLPEGGQDGNDVLEAAVDRKISWVREAAGDRWADLEINVLIFEVDPLYHRRRGPAPARRHGVSEEQFLRSPHYLGGEVEDMAQQLLERRKRWGISYLTLRPSDFEAAAGLVERLAGR